MLTPSNINIPDLLFAGVLLILGIGFIIVNQSRENRERERYRRLRSAIRGCLCAQDRVSIISATNTEDAKVKYIEEMNRLRQCPDGIDTILHLLQIPQLGDIFDISSPE